MYIPVCHGKFYRSVQQKKTKDLAEGSQSVPFSVSSRKVRNLL